MVAGVEARERREQRQRLDRVDAPGATAQPGENQRIDVVGTQAGAPLMQCDRQRLAAHADRTDNAAGSDVSGNHLQR